MKTASKYTTKTFLYIIFSLGIFFYTFTAESEYLSPTLPVPPFSVSVVLSPIPSTIPLRMRVRPFAMKGFAPWLVHPFKRVAAKKVPLRLGQIGGQTCTAVGIKVRQRSTHGRAGNAGRDAQGDHAAPRGLATVDFVGKFGIDQQRRQIWIAFKGLSDAVQETGCKRSQRSRRNREGTGESQ